MSYEFRPAVRENTKPLIGIYGVSGSGKTFTALLLARGLVGPEGTIAMIDTESGRGSLYAKDVPGGYDVITMEPPFSPAAYCEALIDAEAHADVIIVDSTSHEWEGQGGVLDMADAIKLSSGKSGIHCWNEPKKAHKKFILQMLRSKVPIIFCLRAKHKTKQGKDAQGKTQIVKDDYPTPVQDGDFIFEMTAHFETVPNPKGATELPMIRLTKWSQPDLRGCFPQDYTVPVSVETGQKIAAWATGAVDENTKELRDEARKYAKQGRDALNTWWKGLPQPARVTVNPIMAELEKLAQGPSEASQDAEEDQCTDTGADQPTPAGDPRDQDDGGGFGLSG